MSFWQWKNLAFSEHLKKNTYTHKAGKKNEEVFILKCGVGVTTDIMKNRERDGERRKSHEGSG